MARRALILANGAFADPVIPALASPVTDAGRLRDLLAREDVGGYEVTSLADPSSVEARIAVQRFFKTAAPGDFNLILISGHGIRDSRGHLFFATADTRSDVLAATSLDAAFVIAQMDLSAAGRQVAVIDTCYSGAFVHGMVAKAAMQSISRSDFGGEIPDNVRGRAVITASTHIQTANENEVDGRTQSVFTRHLIEGIETGAADADGDGQIGLPELFNYISAKLKVEGSVQTPRLFDYGLAGRVVIARNPAWSAAELPAALREALASGGKAQKMLAVEELHEIVLNGGAEAVLAIAALRRLLRDDYALVQKMARDVLDDLDGGTSGSEPRPADAAKVEPEPESEPGPKPDPPPEATSLDPQPPRALFLDRRGLDGQTSFERLKASREPAERQVGDKGDQDGDGTAIAVPPFLGRPPEDWATFRSGGGAQPSLSRPPASTSAVPPSKLRISASEAAHRRKTREEALERWASQAAVRRRIREEGLRRRIRQSAIAVAVCLALLVIVGVYQYVKQASDKARFEQAEVARLAGSWTYKGADACGTPGDRRMIIAVDDTDVRIDGKAFPRDAITFDRGWMTIGERTFFVQSMALRVIDPDDLALSASELHRCAYGG